MLQKTKSKQIFKLKYLVLVPLVIGMLIYTSCESEGAKEQLDSSTTLKAGSETILEFEDLNNLSKEESLKKVEFLNQVRKTKREATFIMKDRRGQSLTFTTHESGLLLIDDKKDGATNPKQNPKYDLTNYDGLVDIPFAVVEKVPVFPGCENTEDKRVCFNEKLKLHIAENFRYPEEAHKKGIQGRVNIVFLIQKDGSIGGIRMRGPDKILEEEAARIISLLPKMTPGEYRGKKVRVPYAIPITFTLQ